MYYFHFHFLFSFFFSFFLSFFFLALQLTAFEVWLDMSAGSGTKDAPEQLPVVLQVRACCQS